MAIDQGSDNRHSILSVERGAAFSDVYADAPPHDL